MFCFLLNYKCILYSLCLIVRLYVLPDSVEERCIYSLPLMTTMFRPRWLFCCSAEINLNTTECTVWLKPERECNVVALWAKTSYKARRQTISTANTTHFRQNNFPLIMTGVEHNLLPLADVNDSNNNGTGTSICGTSQKWQRQERDLLVAVEANLWWDIATEARADIIRVMTVRTRRSQSTVYICVQQPSISVLWFVSPSQRIVIL